MEPPTGSHHAAEVNYQLNGGFLSSINDYFALKEISISEFVFKCNLKDHKGKTPAFILCLPADYLMFKHLLCKGQMISVNVMVTKVFCSTEKKITDDQGKISGPEISQESQ